MPEYSKSDNYEFVSFHLKMQQIRQIDVGHFERDTREKKLTICATNAKCIRALML